MKFELLCQWLKKIGVWRADIAETGLGEITITVPNPSNVATIKRAGCLFFPASLHVEYRVDTNQFKRRKKHTYKICMSIF